MNPATLVFALLLPLAFWAAYHYYHDRHRPEPLGNLFLSLLLGAGAAYLNRVMYLGLEVVGLRYDALELALTNKPALLIYSVLGIGLTEELAKMLPFVFVVLRFRAFDDARDGIIYASFLALGFSVIENLHFLQFLSTIEGIARGFASPVVHIVFASVWGYHVGYALLARRPVILTALRWLAITAVLHGIYDFIVLGFPAPALLIAAMLIVAVWLWRLRKIALLDDHRRMDDGPTSNAPAPSPR